MKGIKDESVDLILTDPPYGTTASSWDKIVDFRSMWNEYNRIIKPNGAIVSFASGQFTNKLINSQSDIYRYKWVWIKNHTGNFVNAKNRPMTKYEEICVFSHGITANTKHIERKMHYYPQGLVPFHKIKKNSATKFGTMTGKRPGQKDATVQKWTNYPSDVLFFDTVPKGQHPTQKPVELLKYLIKTYTREGEVILDSFMGSGSTGVAAVNTNRHFIGMELDENYFNIAQQRIDEAENEPQAV